MKTFILAGGLGTRLRPVVRHQPKVMAGIRGRPFLEYQIEWLREQGFTDLVLCVGYLANQIVDYFGDGRRLRVRIDYALEEVLLGTAGAIRNGQQFIDGTFLVLNGDSYVEADLRAVIASHRQCRLQDAHTVGTIGSVWSASARSYGCVETAASGRILDFEEKAARGSTWINAGVYVLEPELLRLIPSTRPASLEKEIFPRALASGAHLYAHPISGFFVDIGTPDGYRRFGEYAEVQAR
jgi:NDP-sugar pyrophosphorylase family protein